MRLAAVITIIAASASAMSPGSVEYASRWIGERRATGGAFLPSDYGAVAFWLDFSDADYLFSDTNCTTAVTNGGYVRGIVDKSNGYRFLPQLGGDAARPIFSTNLVNGMSSIYKDSATAGGMYLTNQIVFTGQTVFAVFRDNRSSNGQRVLSQLKTGNFLDYAAGGHIPILQGTSAGVINSYNSAHVAPISTPTNTIKLITSVQSGSIVSNRYNGGASNVTAICTFSPSNNSFTILGGVGAGEAIYQTLSEVVVFQEQLSQEYIEAVESELNAKWGVY